MTRIDIEDMALLEDEVSQLRSENEYLKIAIDGCNHENARLHAELQAAYQPRYSSYAADHGFD